MAADDEEKPSPERRIRKGEWVYRSILGKNKVYFIRHALDRMKQRGVFREEVFTTIKNPAESGLPTQPGRKRVRWYRSEQTIIDVVYEEHDDHLRIISVNRTNAGPTSKRTTNKKTPKTKQRKPGGRGRQG